MFYFLNKLRLSIQLQLLYTMIEKKIMLLEDLQTICVVYYVFTPDIMQH